MSLSRFSDIQPHAHTQDDLEDLNDDLETLIEIFPNVDPEAFRELLQHVGRKSRRAFIVDRLLTDEAKWIQDHHRRQQRQPLQPVERFRSEDYKRTVSDLLHQEFKGLSKSSIKAVLAENNHCYAQCRPALQAISSKSWRVFFTNILSRKKDRQNASGPHPLIAWRPSCYGVNEPMPVLLPTASPELDAEITRTLIEPVHTRHRMQSLATDKALAAQLNYTEAEAASALFDCECCFSSTTFEQLAVCSGHGHYLCFDCVRHAMTEALFGQGWASSIDSTTLAVRCLAPSTTPCMSSISSEATRRAVLDHPKEDGEAIWQQFQTRIATDELKGSQLSLSSCPFCSYAEVDDSLSKIHPRSFIDTNAALIESITAMKFKHTADKILTLVLVVLASPLLYALLLLLTSWLVYIPHVVRTSMHHTVLRKQGLRFTCGSQTCGKQSCVLCHQEWVDPHTCSRTATKPTLDSLRHEIELATTRAIKRTCPKCNLSFVKDTGCNKFVCSTCGYIMCYVCRQQISKSEGYNHFCRHFRPDGTQRKCTQCTRCDLWATPDDAEVIRQAARDAEKEWLHKAAASGHSIGASRSEVGEVTRVVLGTHAKPRNRFMVDVQTNFTNGMDVLFDAFLLAS